MPVACPIEGQKCRIVVNVPKELWPAITVKLNGTLLPLKLDAAAMKAFLEWPPCNPGNYELTLECGDIRERRAIKVLPQHFSEVDLNTIVSDLQDRMPQLVASQLKECGALVDTNLVLDQEPSIEQEFGRLSRALNGTKQKLGLLQLLPIIQRDCYHILVPQCELKKANQTRKPDISKLATAMAMPGNIYPSGALKFMFDVTVERSYETYENRLVKAYVQAIQSQLSRLQVRVEEQKVPPAFAAELESIVSEYRLACNRAAFLREVRQPFASGVRVTMVLLKNTAYRAVFEGYLALYRQASIRLDEPALESPLANFPRLYERWANLAVVNALLQVCIDTGFRCVSHPWVQRDGLGLYLPVMPVGEASLKFSCPSTGRTIIVVPWKPDNAVGIQGTSELPPALAIAIYSPEKSPVVLLFTAKYHVAAVAKQATKKTMTRMKALSQVKVEVEPLSGIQPRPEDIQELLKGMQGGKTTDGVREIQYAAILFPGQRKQIAPDLEALPARPAAREALEQSIYDELMRYLD
ncbi:hypothetical protein BH11CYA1_BH11CYA1_44010 [soil metagenome]